MTIQVTEDPRFEFDKADRLRRAIRVSGLSVGELAEKLEVNRNTVSNWINGRNQPRRRDIREFALATGFPVAWLETGDEGPHGGSPTSQYTPRDLNPEPTDYGSIVDLSAWRVLQAA